MNTHCQYRVHPEFGQIVQKDCAQRKNRGPKKRAKGLLSLALLENLFKSVVNRMPDQVAGVSHAAMAAPQVPPQPAQSRVKLVPMV